MPGGEIRVRLEGDEALLRKLRELGIKVSDVLEQAVDAAAEIVQAGAIGLAPGPAIERDTTMKRATRVEVEVGPDREHWYYRFAETGAAVHGIAPKTAKVVLFYGDAGETFRARVTHPGIPATPFLRPAMDSRSDEAQREMGDEWKRAIRSVT